MRDARVSTAARDIQANAIGAALANGYVRVYPAGCRPESVDEAVTENALATLRFADVAFNPSVGGLILSLPLIPDLNTTGGADSSWFRASTEDGVALFDGSVGIKGSADEGNLNFNESLTVQPGGEMHIGSVSYRVI